MSRILVPFVLLLLCGGLSCMSPSSSEGPPTGETETADVPGTLSGYLMDDGGLKLVGSPDEATTAAPVAGAEIRVRPRIGEGERTVITAEDGGYEIADLPHGVYDLEVSRGSGAELAKPVSVIPGARVAPGAESVVSRDDAIEAVLGSGLRSAPGPSADPDGPVILSFLEPLPAGTKIRPSGRDESAPAARTLTAPAWFFFVDPDPSSGYAHPVEYVTVDAASGAVSRSMNVDAPPVVNGTKVWSSDRDYIVYENVSFGASGLVTTGEPVATPTPEVVRLPVPGSGTGLTVSAAISAPVSPATDPEDLFSLTILTGNDTWMWRSVNLWTRWMDGQGVPAGQRATLLVPDITFAEWGSRLRTARDGLYAKIEQRLADGGRPVLLVYMIGHHRSASFLGSPSGTMAFEFKGGEEYEYGLSLLNLDKARACVVHFFLDTCFAEHLARALVRDLSRVDFVERPDLRIYASCDSTEYSKGQPMWKETLTLGLVEAGATFTKSIVERMSLEDGEITGLLSGRRFVPGLTTLRTGLLTQTPVFVPLIALPGWCEGWGIPLIDVSPPALDVMHPPSDPCPQEVATIFVESRTFEEAEFTVTVNHPALHAEPASGTLRAGGNGTVEVRIVYDCEPPGPVDAVVRITARAYDGAFETIRDLPVRVRVTSGAVSDTLRIRHPGAFSTGEWQIWHPIPEGARVDSTGAFDVDTGLPAAAQPWIPNSPLAVRKTFEGWNSELSNYYGAVFEANNIFSPAGCSTCRVLRWIYTVYYSFPESAVDR